MALFSKKAAAGPQVDFDHLPRHIAIIMDGNGRWAKSAACPAPPATRRGRRTSAPSPPTARISAWSI